VAKRLTNVLKDFAEGDGSLASAKTLKGEDQERLLLLIEQLAQTGKRAHLENLGAAGLHKDIKKAARKAAYQLKSAGVGGDGGREAGLDLRVEVDLTEVALVTAPGLRGQGWTACVALPDAEGLEVVCDGHGDIKEISALEGLAVGRMRRALREARETSGSALPVLADASLALRCLGRLAAEVALAGLRLPATWSHVERWTRAVAAHGADPEQASARARLAGRLADLDPNLARTTEAVLDVSEAGVMLPDEAAIEALMVQVGEAVHGKIELTEVQFKERLEGMADAAADAWLADETRRRRVAHRLETSADVLLAGGHDAAALQCLWVSDQLAAGGKLPHELGLIQQVFRGIISYEAAWEHYADHFADPEGHVHDDDDDDDGLLGA
jgi:hypothetical protein